MTQLRTLCVSNSGNNANDGLSPEKALLTCSRAAYVAKAGDDVIVAPGIYPESFGPSSSGSQGLPIRFLGTGAQIVGFNSNRKSFLEVRGFRVIGPKALDPRYVDMPAALVDDASVVIDPKADWSAIRRAQIDAKYSTYMTMRRAFDLGFTVGIWVRGSSSVVVDGCDVSNHTVGIDCDEGSTQVTLTRNSCHHNRDGIFSWSSTAGPSFSDSLVEDNECRQNLGSGIVINKGDKVTVRKNECELNGIHHIVLSAGASNCLVEWNTVSKGGFYSETMPLPGSSAFNCFAVGPGNRLQFNVASQQIDATLNDGNGFIADTGQFPVSFLGNVAFRCQGSGISLTHTDGCSVVGNTLVENTTGARTGSSIRNVVTGNAFVGNLDCGFRPAGQLRLQAKVEANLYAGSPAVRDSFDQAVVYQTAEAVFLATGFEAR